VTGLLLRLYALAERSGALRLPPFEWLFVRSYFAYKRLFEDVYARLARERPELFRGGHIVDAGANAGYTARVFARAVEAPYRVYAFEPEATNFRRLTRFAGDDRIIPIQSALGDREGTAKLWHNPTHPGDHRVLQPVEGSDPSIAQSALGERKRTAKLGHNPTYPSDHRVLPHLEGSDPSIDPRSVSTVAMTTVDELARTLNHPIRFVKIDVQGYEPAVLRGMRETLRGDVVVALEFAPAHIRAAGFQPDEVFDLLRGFEIERLGDESRGYVDLLCVRKGGR
jgi:FkbM family methyltransferase